MGFCTAEVTAVRFDALQIKLKSSRKYNDWSLCVLTDQYCVFSTLSRAGSLEIFVIVVIVKLL